MYPRKYYPEAIIFSIIFTSFFIYWEKSLEGQDMPSEDILEFLYHIPGALPILFLSIMYVYISKRGTGEFAILWYLAAIVLAPLTLMIIGIIGTERQLIVKEKATQKVTGLNQKVSELEKIYRSGVITEEQYNRNLSKLKSEQTDINLKSSSKYQDLLKALENDFITQDEFEKKVAELKRQSEKTVGNN